MRNRASYLRLWLCVRSALGWAPVTSPEPRPESDWARHSRTCSQLPYAVARKPEQVARAESVRSGELRARLADAVQQCGEPRRADVERLAASDPLELNGPEFVAALLVVPDQAGSSRSADSTAKSVMDLINARSR